jgi:hypothetical protein
MFLLPKNMVENPKHYHLVDLSVEEREHGFYITDQQTGQHFFGTKTAEGEPGSWFLTKRSKDFPYTEDAPLSDESAEYWSNIVKTAKAIERSRIRKFINELWIEINQRLPKPTCPNSGW